MKKDNLRELFVDGLKDLYDAEHQLIDALPKMAEASSSNDLRTGFETHLEQTRQQARRLEQVFSDMGIRPERKKCLGMQGIIKEGEQVMEETRSDPDTRDAGMIASAQKVEHYEISGYGTARTYAQTLGMDHVAQLLETTLKEESATDEKLTRIAERHINVEAMS